MINPSNPSVIYSSYVYGTIYRFRNKGTMYDGQILFGTWKLYISTDQGNHWHLFPNPVDLTKGVTNFGADVISTVTVDPRDSRVIFTGSAQGRVMSTTNGGSQWKDITRGLPKRFITSIRVDSNGVVYLTVSGFGSGHVFRSTDGGSHWTDLSSTLPNIPVNTLLVDPLNSRTLYVGTDVGVYRSIDEGSNWFKFNEGMPPVIVTGFSAQSTGAIQVATYGRGAYELER